MSRSQTETQSGFVHGALLNVVDRTPGRVALIFQNQSLTFQELATRAASFAALVKPMLKADANPRVALCLPNSPAVVDVFFGTLVVGGCVCLFDPDWPLGLLVELLADHKPDVLVASDALLADIADHLGSTEALPLSALSMDQPNDTQNQTQEYSATADDPFLIGFTSGSSGKPKAFIRSHLTWIESFGHSADELGTTGNDCVLAPGPLSHGLSLYAAVEGLCAGATVIIQSKFKVSDTLHAIKSHDVTSLVVVPAMLDALVAEDGIESHAGLKRIITAGAKLSPALRTRAAALFPSAEMMEYYGASELSFITVAKGSERVPPESVGRAFAGVEISIRAEDGQVQDVNNVGTVWIRSSMICSGYVGPTDGSGLRQEGGWATVGDLGHLDENGFLFLAGREGSAITSAGYTVYPSAIESALLAHPDIVDAAVIGLPHDRWGEVIAAAVVPFSGLSPTEQELEAHCRTTLEPYACPRVWRIADELERTQSGKIKRSALNALFESENS